MGVSGEDEGVAIGTGAVEVQEAAGVLHSIGVIVRVDDPVVIVCKPESQSHGPPSASAASRETHHP